VVLLDVQMPEMDGLEVARRVRRDHHGGNRPYLIAVTANAMAGDRESCLAAGMDDYVSKPIRREDLVAALRRSEGAPAPPVAAAVADASAGQPPSGNGAGVLDERGLDRLFATLGAGGRDLLPELVRTFEDDGRRLLAELRDGIAEGRVTDVRRAAHSLKSNAANFGATALADLARRLEASAQGGSLDGGVDLALAIEAEYRRVQAALHELVEGAPPA
jgi:CheY-like chemotaxis protein